MPIVSLPTGEEPPKGFETLVNNDPTPKDGLRIDCVFLSQLSAIELAEIETLRGKALDTISNLVGLSNEALSFENETNLIPDKSPSDKMLFRAYKDGWLAGYALVINGWPNPCEWVIQHMIIDPKYRLQGIGSTIVSTIEKYALSSEIEATSIFAIPLEKKGKDFWSFVGYTVEMHRRIIKIAGLNHELVIYRKELAD